MRGRGALPGRAPPPGPGLPAQSRWCGSSQGPPTDTAPKGCAGRTKGAAFILAGLSALRREDPIRRGLGTDPLVAQRAGGLGAAWLRVLAQVGQPQKRQPLRPGQKGIQKQQRWMSRRGFLRSQPLPSAAFLPPPLATGGLRAHPRDGEAGSRGPRGPGARERRARGKLSASSPPRPGV